MSDYFSITHIYISMRQRFYTYSTFAEINNNFLCLVFMRMSLLLHNCSIMLTECFITYTVFYLHTSNRVPSSTYLNTGRYVCKSLIRTKTCFGPNNIPLKLRKLFHYKNIHCDTFYRYELRRTYEW